MRWQDFSWRTASPVARRLIVGAGIVVLVVGAYLIGRSGSAPPGPAARGPAGERASQLPADATGPVQTATAGTGPIPLTQLCSGPCSTFAPEGCRITDQNKERSVATVASADGSLIGAIAAWRSTPARRRGCTARNWSAGMRSSTPTPNPSAAIRRPQRGDQA